MFKTKKSRALICNKINYDALKSISSSLAEYFSWWENNIMSSINDIRHDTVSLEIYSDDFVLGKFPGTRNSFVRANVPIVKPQKYLYSALL